MNNQTEHTQEIKYYEINEDDQKHARDMYSYTSYVMGTCTKEYIENVKSVYAAANEVENSQREYAFQLADRYARKPAEFHNRFARIEMMCPSVLICGPANFPVRKKEKQNAASTYYMQYCTGDVQSLEDWQAEDYTREWITDQEILKAAFCEHHDASEWIDQPTPTPAGIIQYYIDLGCLIEVRRTETDAEREDYGEWMDA